MVPDSRSIELNSGSLGAGLLIINADDWGRDVETTDRILECALRGVISSASAMVFMEDSDRAAVLAREHNVDVGLHLNFTTPFTAREIPNRLGEQQERLARFLLHNRLSQVLYHPGLADSFEYVVRAQLDEFCRTYAKEPSRVDGHHHMHLCANVLLGRLLPFGTIARRNFSFQPGEKSVANRLYRSITDRVLARRHQLTDFFFSLPPIDLPDRLKRIFGIARQHVVELETHPVNPGEYQFLHGGEFRSLSDGVNVAVSFQGFLRAAAL